MSKKLAALALGIALASCSKSPTAPASLPANALDLTGMSWTGYIRINACSSPGHCANFVGAMYPFTLTIAPGATIDATLTAVTPESYTVLMPGTIEADGTHVFRGGVSSNGRVEVRELRVKKDRDAVITGTIDYTSNRNTSDPRTISGVIPSATLQRDLRNPGTAGIPSLNGTWVGTGRTDACTGLNCGFMATPRSFTITIQESADRIAALLDSDLWARKVLELEGSRQADGSVRFTGSWVAEGGNERGEFRHFTVSSDPALGLAGSFEWVETDPRGTTLRTGAILSGSRYVVVRAPGPFQGEWRGDFVPRTCSGDCAVVRLGTPSSLSLVLLQVGATVTGAVIPAAPRSVPVQGTANGTSVALDGESIVDVCLYDWEGPVVCTQRLRSFAVGLDGYGRLTGSFELFREGWQGNLHYRYTITAELRNVVRRLR